MPLLARLLCQAIANDADPPTTLLYFDTLMLFYLPEYAPELNSGDSDHKDEYQPPPPLIRTCVSHHIGPM
jgi:hypothetical protein